MSNRKPRISIGMPVYNGEKFLREALDSILAQTFEDFELIISDNASSDKTEEICREYAAQDRRILYYRNEKNIGVNRNFNRVFELSSGEYFRWAAYDDVLAPELLSKCSTVLDNDPSIVMCYPKTLRIDEHGAVVGNYDCDMKVDSSKPYERFGDLVCVDHYCMGMFGLIRVSVLRTTRLKNYLSADWNFLAELGLVGRLYEIPEYLFFRRDHAQTTESAWRRKDRKFLLEWYKPTNAGQVTFPTWRRTIEYFVSIRRIPLSRSEQLLCYAQVGRWFLVRLQRRINKLKCSLARTSDGIRTKTLRTP